MKIIDKFENKYAFLSNYYYSPITEEGITYPTVEHYFQAHKTKNADEMRKIAAAFTPGAAKSLGRQVRLRGDWEEVKDEIMEQGLKLKFRNRKLAEALLATGDAELIEGNTWCDNIWGNCTCPKCAKTPGENRLGKLLMEIRSNKVLY